MKERVEVQNADVARVLTDSTQVRLLAPFFHADTTLSDAAKELNVKLTTLLYHVTKFIRLDILEVSKEEARKGKAVKYYRTTAKIFFVPFDRTPNLSLKHLITQLTQPNDEVFNREMAKMMQDVSAEWGVEIFSDSPRQRDINISFKGKDKPRKSMNSFDPDGPALTGLTGGLHLDFATAKAFEKDLRKLLECYHEKQNAKEQLYYYRIGLTPVQDESLEPKD
jgi:hypothetical protein